MFTRSGIVEGIDIALHHRKPIDAMELNDWLIIDLGPMLDAQSAIWLHGNEVLIKGASDVVMAAGEVISKSTSIAALKDIAEMQASGDRIGAALKRLKTLPRDDQSEEERIEAVAELGRACRTFGRLMRAELKTTDPEALTRAFQADGSPRSLENSQPQ
jgi:hypothetical protein